MDVDRWSSVGSRLCFAVAVLLFLLAVIEWVLGRFGVAFWIGYDAGRLTEFAAMLLIPVVTVLLRQIRDELRKQKPA